ncbi:MAG: TerC family protein [Desulfobacterales bacterium]
MIELGAWGSIEFSWSFLLAVGSIVLIDLVLAGDNAVVIAMAVKHLEGRRRTLAIACGAGAAVLVRVACTFAVARLLSLPFIKLIGGAVIVWIAVKLLTSGSEEGHEVKAGRGLLQALWIIVVADLSMGIDNLLAVGAASHGNLFLLLFGLILSIPFVVFMSTLLARLMDRFPIILWLGAAILGKVGGEMMATDPFVHARLELPHGAEYAAMAFFTLFVLLMSRWILVRRRKGPPAYRSAWEGGPVPLWPSPVAWARVPWGPGAYPYC